jgi:hypothetical protein
MSYDLTAEEKLKVMARDTESALRQRYYQQVISVCAEAIWRGQKLAVGRVKMPPQIPRTDLQLPEKPQ